MDAMEAENLLKKLDRRMQNVEQILPTLPVREETVTHEQLEAVVARLATKDDLAAAIAPLATKAEVREEGERTRQAFDAVADSLRDDIRLIAESQVGLQVQFREEAERTRRRFEVVDKRHLAMQAEMRLGRKRIERILTHHEGRITRLEASGARRRTRKKR